MAWMGSSETYLTVPRERVVIVGCNFKEGALVCEQSVTTEKLCPGALVGEILEGNKVLHSSWCRCRQNVHLQRVGQGPQLQRQSEQYGCGLKFGDGAEMRKKETSLCPRAGVHGRSA